MEENNANEGNNNNNEEAKAFKGFVYKRLIVGVLLAFAGLWIVGTILGYFEPSPEKPTAAVSHGDVTVADEHAAPATSHDEDLKKASKTSSEGETHSREASEHAAVESAPAVHSATASQEKTTHAAETAGTHQTKPSESSKAAAATHAPAASETQKAAAAGAHGGTATVFDRESGYYEPKGVAFINAVVKPLEYELTQRFYGWRPNDIFDFTDNVNNFQLGVLEVTRRTVVALAERLSRTGSTASFDKNLENAMNWFMIKADRYWFPSPESKYKAGLEELKVYKEKLQKGEARFHTRTDNLIPLLMAFEDLLGSCDENLVKHAEDDGAHVSFFSADDYFFYAKGVASTMYHILEAVKEDFGTTVEGRRGAEVLHHAIESCKEAMEIDPILILNSSWSSIFANHRANMAAPISHARFYMGLLIKTLST